MVQQGKALSHGQRLSIITLKKSYDEEKKAGPTVSTKDSIGRVTRGLDIGRRTVEKVLSDYNKNGKNLIEVPPKPPMSFGVTGNLLLQNKLKNSMLRLVVCKKYAKSIRHLAKK